MGDQPTYKDLEKRVKDFELEIADLKTSEEILRRSEEKYRSILENIEDEYYEIDLEGNYTFLNQAVCKNQGLPREELIGMNAQGHLTPGEGKRLFKILREVYRTGIPSGQFEYEVTRKDGTVVYFEDSVSLLRNAAGEPVGFSGIARNITERKKNEKALREREEKYRHILENIEEGYYECDLSGNFTFFNEAECRIHGLSPEEMKGLNNRDFSSPRTSKRVFTIYNEVYKTGIPAKVIDYEVIAKDGSIKTLETSASLLRNQAGELVGFYGISRDVTERKKAEQTLRESEERYRNILNSLEEAYYEVDLAGNFIFFNEAMCKSYGRSFDELMGMNYREYALPEDVEKIFKVFNTVYLTSVSSAILDFRIVRIDGEIRTIEGSVALLRNPAGESIGFYGIARDRTEQKKVEKALAESEEKYRLLVENANDGIYILQDGVVRFANPKMESLTGYSTRELSQIDFWNLLYPSDREGLMQWQIKVLTGEQRPGPNSFRLINTRNEALWVEVNTVDIEWGGRPATLNFLRDMTLQKKMETQLLQVQKMEAVGTLAGGIAHDFNNLLMSIQGNASLILLDMHPHDPHYSKLKNIEQQVQAGSELTKQLLGSARGGKYEVKPTDINTILKKTLDLFGRTRKEIIIHTYLQEEVRTVEVDQVQMEQVFLNLFINAGHAMPAGGDLYVETKNVFLDEAYVRPFNLPFGRYIRISVTDTGIGMDEATQKRAFDPFFTTKEMGRGTGLGLASAYGIVKNHSGIINIYSEKGQGTTFNIYLPVTEKKIKEEANFPEEILTGTGTILFVDDEEAIAQIGRRLLERLGYRVITARNGSEAVEIYRREGDLIDLVILDMIMQGMGGGETFDRLKEIDPQVKVILSSGYSINGQAKTILDRGCKGFLQKPFSLTDLSKKVRQVLDEEE